jgi:peptidoglycan/xylan/chitin deacetylase (PgdA/CDA1 family)
MKTIISSILFLIASICIAQNKIAITIDDLPCTNCEHLDDAIKVNEKLIETFRTYKVPAIGFVNENKLYTEEQPDQNKIALLREWLKNDLDLGNHTFSHIYIDNATIEQYEADILKGEIIIRPLTREYGKDLKYFRHTQLRTGPTPEYKAQLDEVLADNNYIVAPVTMDNDEYIYAYCYHKAKIMEIVP